jgi:phosphoglycolate phosphatase
MAETVKNREIIGNIALFKSKPCDSNLLGFVSDIAQQVAEVDSCVVFCAQANGLKLSIRSGTREIMASELAEFLCCEVGSGGGNIEKAGGYLSYAKISEKDKTISPDVYLRKRIIAYLDNFDLIYAGNNDIDFASFPLYRKLPIPIGFIKSTDVFPQNTKIRIRTLEGDIDTLTSDNIYFIIGIQGEVYPIAKKRFETSYHIYEESYKNTFDYVPTILNSFSGERHLILPYAKTCIAKDTKIVRAKEVRKDTKVFTDWDTDKYFYMSPGGYLVANEDNYSDCYLVHRDIFFKSYAPVT